MKKKLALLIGLVLLFGFGQIVSAGDLPKHSTFSATFYHSGTYKIMMAGPKFTEGHVYMVGEAMGVLVNDTGQPFLNKASGHNLFALHAMDGVKDLESWFHIFTDLDGDKAFMQTTARGKLLEAAEGTFTFVGGTGKYTGLSGSGEIDWNPVPTVAEGTYQGISKLKGHYKLP
jgi:hypothetical protein